MTGLEAKDGTPLSTGLVQVGEVENGGVRMRLEITGQAGLKATGIVTGTGTDIAVGQDTSESASMSAKAA